MAYQNPYMNYQTGYQPQDLPIMQSQASYHAPYSNGINWVSGEVGAKSYLVAPNSTVLLMDSDDAVFYLKSADIAGLPTLRTFSYVDIESNQNKQKSNELQKELVDREGVELFKKEILEKIKTPSTKTKKTTNTDEQEL